MEEYLKPGEGPAIRGGVGTAAGLGQPASVPAAPLQTQSSRVKGRRGTRAQGCAQMPRPGQAGALRRCGYSQGLSLCAPTHGLCHRGSHTAAGGFRLHWENPVGGGFWGQSQRPQSGSVRDAEPTGQAAAGMKGGDGEKGSHRGGAREALVTIHLLQAREGD